VSNAIRTTPFPINLKAFCQDIDALREELKQSIGQSDLQHFKRVEQIVWGLVIFGFGSAWMSLNIVSILALAAAGMARWCILSHHISHRGYERIPGAPLRYQSHNYGRGWRRYIHWLDWMLPEAWHHEHDILHHYNLGEHLDPDVPGDKTQWISQTKLPIVLKCMLIFILACFWKPIYYAPNTLNALLNKKEKTEIELGSWAFWSPKGKRFWTLACRCWLPYIIVRFGLIPASFLLITPQAALNVLYTLLIVEVITNLWTYLIIVPNHAGADIYVFDEHARDRATFYLHQVVGSVDYRCGSNWRDFLQGWLNYQIEHHLFPDLTILQYQKAHPRVKAICQKHGIPMVVEPLYKRLIRLVKIQIGLETQPLWPGIKDLSGPEDVSPIDSLSPNHKNGRNNKNVA